MTVTHPMAEDYLRRLERATRVLPRRQRDELLAEIRSHVDSGLGPDPSEAEVRNLLDELGAPAEIVAAAQPDGPPAVRRGAREVFALILLVLGFPPILGWMIGAGLLLWSPLWSARQKLLGILVWPGGLGLVVGVGGFLVAATSTGCAVRQPSVVSGAGAGAPDPVNSGSPVSCAATHNWPYAGAVIIVALIIAQVGVAGYLFWAAGRKVDQS